MQSNFSIKRFGILPLLCSLASCSSTLPTDAPETSFAVPDTWENTPAQLGNAPQDSPDLQLWWRAFNDPTLDRLVEQALVSSTDIRSSLSRVRESRARYGIERSNLFPSLSASASGRQSESRNHDTNTTSNSESYGASLDASWEVDLFGSNQLSVAAAAANLSLSEANFESVQSSLAAEVALTYVTLRSAEARLQVLNENLALREETTQLTQWREEAGTADSLATQQAVASLQQARASLPSIQQSITQTRNALALLCGLPPGSLDDWLQKTGSIPAAPPYFALGIPADTLRQRPDVRAAEFGIQSSYALLKISEKQQLPSLRLSGSIGIDALKAGDLFSPETTIASIAESLTAPIFQAGRIKKTITVQNEQLQQSVVTYETTLLNALAEVENALVAIQRNSERKALIDQAASAADEAARLAGAQYEAGQVDIFNVLDAQRTLLSIQEQQLSTAADQTNALIQLYKSLGGGWVPYSEFADNRS